MFSSNHVVLPVIHVSHFEQALANVRIAAAAGADGVFLINHGIRDAELLAIHARVSEQFPRWWIGVNCLGLDPREIFGRLSPAVSGLWVDDAGIDEQAKVQTIAAAVTQARVASQWQGLYFGGVAFKYRRPVADPAAAARAAADHVDVVTTSGPGTGQAAEVAKIQAMKAALGRGPLAIASGITPDNVRNYLPHADCFLVATGISRSFHDLEPALVARLVGTVRAHDGQSRHLPWPARALRDELPEVHHVVTMVDLTHGPVFEFDLHALPEPEPLFAYCDDVGSNTEVLSGLVEVGTRAIANDRYMWLNGTRQCRLFRASRAHGGKVQLRSRSVGEFCCELYRITPDDSAELLWRDDFCLK